jgi:hemerythrin
MKVEWNETFAVGIDVFDTHHKRLFQIINEFFSIYKNESRRTRCKELAFELLDYTYFHFGAEERAMKQHQFPDYDNHLERHKEFKRIITKLFNGIMKLTEKDIYESLMYLVDWLGAHIAAMDKEYGRYFKAQGVDIQ